MILDFDPVAVVQAAIAKGLARLPQQSSTPGLNEVRMRQSDNQPRKTKCHPALRGLPRGSYSREYQRLKRRGLI